MFDVIQMTNPYDQPYCITESYLNNGVDPCERMYTEAVFTDGRKTVEPMIETMKQIKEVLIAKTEDQRATSDRSKGYRRTQKFDAEAFWRHPLFKQLEDQFQKAFGFRSAMIQPLPEKYDHNSGKFESKELNAYVYSINRYPIEGLVTDKGFYDKSNSLYLDMYMTLGLIKELEPDEIIAVILHEIGHSIDPALVSVRYTQTNILSKYLTDRKGSINSSEEAVIKKSKLSGSEIIYIIRLLLMLIPALIRFFTWLFRTEEGRIRLIKKMVREDKSTFSRQEYTEAYADNFARMYGMAGPLSRGLLKISKDIGNQIHSWFWFEKSRQECILSMIQDLLKDEHKTDIHRIRALIKEYKDDINDLNTPAKVKQQLKDDLKELETVLDQYMNEFGEFQNRVNRAINEELAKKENRAEKAKAKDADSKPSDKK